MTLVQITVVAGVYSFFIVFSLNALNGDLFNKGNAIYLYIINFRTKFYDFVLFDTPPFFGVSTTSTLFTNSKVFVLIPTTPDKFGIEGVKDTIEDIEAVQEGFSFFGIDIVIAGIVITQVDKGPGFSKKSIKQVKAREAVSTLEKIAEEHNTKVFEQYLFNNKQYKDMIANQANVFTNSGYSIPQKQITNVMNELIKTIGEHNGEKA